MKSPQAPLSITADAVQSFAPFDYVAAQTSLGIHGAGSARSPARRAAAQPAPPITQPLDNDHPSLAVIIREVLTIAAVGGMFWFQIEIVRCFW